MVAFDIVDYLYDRPVIIGQTIQNHRVALLDDWEPLPVGVELGREISQCRVAGISQDSQCTGRNWAVQVFADSPEHTVIPIIRLEKSAYRLILMFVFRRTLPPSVRYFRWASKSSVTQMSSDGATSLSAAG